MTITLYHNPRCSKSRLTLELLNQQSIEPKIVEYLKTPPNAVELQKILSALNMQPRDLMRKGQAEYTELQLDDKALTNEQLINVMVANPILIERPIVINNDKAAIGRPPESVLEIL